PHDAPAVQRQPDGTTTRSTASGQARASTSPPSVAGAQANAGPCAVDAPALSNEGLLLQLNRARVYLSQHERGEGQFYDYANLFRRLSRERQARVSNGHVWLAEPGLLHVPDMLYG